MREREIRIRVSLPFFTEGLSRGELSLEESEGVTPGAKQLQRNVLYSRITSHACCGSEYVAHDLELRRFCLGADSCELGHQIAP